MAGGAVTLSAGVLKADDGDVKEFLGSWDTIHSLPFPPGFFREFLSFASGGVVHETNSFLNTASNLDLSFYNLPNVVNAADGFGNFARVSKGAIRVVFRKMLYNGARECFGYLKATGTLRSNGENLLGDWDVNILDWNGKLLVPLGPATTTGKRIRE
jgi:hypothetical protein